MKSKIIKILEGFVTFIILLVIIHTLLEDLAIILNWSENARTLMLFTSFFFDLFFTLEFLIRFANALSKKKASKYIFFERGWIDFLAAIPLLIFSSGPPLLAYLMGGTVLAGLGSIYNILKLVKAIRIARILRILKIFRNIKYADSAMAQRHVAKIITTSITVIVFSIFGYSILQNNVKSMNPNSEYENNRTEIISILENKETISEYFIDDLVEIENSILQIKKNDEPLYRRYDRDFIIENFSENDFIHRVIENKGLEILFDVREENASIELKQSWNNVFFFSLVMLIVFAYMIFYSAHFAMTVTDPINVMKRGMEEKSYNLEVKLPKYYKTDELFLLAKSYNEIFLPLKDRNSEDNDVSDVELKMDDLKDILG
jgi:hypothetical protein